jgi:16S rRNA (guanine527-N7)-methyltransferase
VTEQDFASLLVPLLKAHRLDLSEDQQGQLSRYYELLSRWNERINLTALPMAGYPESTLNRLIVEPAIASTLLDDRPLHMLDLGSGGGSPAIPLNIFRPMFRVTMVESRERKAAFLREAARECNLKHTAVINSRFEELNISVPVDVVTVRAVRLDGGVLSLIHRFLVPNGRLLIFGPRETPPLFRPLEYCQLPGENSYLTLLVKEAG